MKNKRKTKKRYTKYVEKPKGFQKICQKYLKNQKKYKKNM